MAEQSANRELIHCLPFSPYRLLLPARERLNSMPTKNSFDNNVYPLVLDAQR